MKKYLLTIVITCLGWVIPASANVAFNNANTIQHVAATSFSGAMSVTAGGSNLAAFCSVSFNASAADSISSVTYGGQTMTSAGAAATQGSPNFLNVQWFYLVNPPTGSNTLAVTGGANIVDIYVNLVSFTGVNQSTPIRPATYTTGADVTNPSSLVISSNVSDLTVSNIQELHNILSTNQTSDGFSNAGTRDGGSDHATTPAASVTHQWTFDTSGAWAAAGFSIQPPAATVANGADGGKGASGGKGAN